MPEIKFQHVVSCSSEDKNHPADNLLRPEGTHKWKNATAGEKSISIVLQFEKSSQIQSIDIGNEGSAFVEILVGRATAHSDQDFQVLLVASAFMSPLEARNGTNRTSVRMFGVSQLAAPVASQKWDRVKIVCTQPFNKTSTYGLSFVKFHSPPDSSDKGTPKGDQKVLGHFKLKSDENGDVKTGSLFSNRGKTETAAVGSMSAAAAARTASRNVEDSPKPAISFSSPASAKSSSTKPSTPKETPIQKKKAEIQTKTKASPSPSQNREKRKHHVSDDDDTEEEEDSKPPLRKQSTSLSSVSSKSSAKDDKPPPMKKTKSEPPKASPAKEFSQLLDSVVFVLSGFQNPYRGEIRDKATAMGAIYKPDWGKGCTHLVCAFKNTPKYNQVRGKGKIVSQKWINDCYKQRKLLPWRQYRLGDAESPSEDSESEDEYNPPTKTTPKAKTATPQKKNTPVKKSSEMYGDDSDSGEDTEDEIRRVKEKESKRKAGGDATLTSKAPDDDEAIYGADTDEDEPGPSKTAQDEDSGEDSGLPELPDFFANKTFFLYGSMEATERRLLTRYITAYDGELEEYMGDKVNYIVTSSKWDSNFDDALSDNPDLIFVKPKWIFKCHEKTKLLPHQPYIVVPDS